MPDEKMVKIRAPITVKIGGRYLAPGAEIELPESEARALTEAHGEYVSVPVMALNDPANTQPLLETITGQMNAQGMRILNESAARDEVDRKAAVAKKAADDAAAASAARAAAEAAKR